MWARNEDVKKNKHKAELQALRKKLGGNPFKLAYSIWSDPVNKDPAPSPLSEMVALFRYFQRHQVGFKSVAIRSYGLETFSKPGGRRLSVPASGRLQKPGGPFQEVV
jgi:hypothetical protein